MSKSKLDKNGFNFCKPFDPETHKLTGNEVFEVVQKFTNREYVIFFSRFCTLVIDEDTHKIKTKRSYIFGHPVPYLFARSTRPISELVCGLHDDLRAVFTTDLVVFSKDKKFFKAKIKTK